MIFNPENPFPEMNSSDPSTISIFFEVESYHMPAAGYSKRSHMEICRRESTKLIKYYGDSYSGDPVIPYLALNYYDNFISTHPIPEKLEGQKDNLPFLATCCFISASKMRKPEFSTSDFMMEKNLNFKMEDIVEMETLIDRWLDQRNCKRPVTALCFLDFFIEEFSELDADQVKCIKSFATHKLYALQYDMRYTEFKPSIMAAAALVWSSITFYKHELDYFLDTLLTFDRVNEESLTCCIEIMIPDLTVLSGSPTHVASGPGSSWNLVSAADEADDATSEASLEPNEAPMFEFQDTGSSSHGLSWNTAEPISMCPQNFEESVSPVFDFQDSGASSHGCSSYTAMLMLPPSVPPPNKNSVTAMPMLPPSVPPPYKNPVTAMPMLPPSVPPPSKNSVTAVDQEEKREMSFNLENPLSSDSSDTVPMSVFFELESYQMAADGYSTNLNMIIYRQEAMQLIKQYAYSCSCEPVIPYLAVSYFDNFISTQPVPKKLEEWRDNLRLVTTCCFISAWRMRKAEFSTSDFLLKQNLDFKIEDVVEIETLIDRWLDRRNCKRPLTALCFLDFFIGLLTELNHDQKIYLKSFATHKIYANQYEMQFTNYKPSMMAALALLSSCARFYKEKLAYFMDTFCDCDSINEKSLLGAIKVIFPVQQPKLVIKYRSKNIVASSPTSRSNTAEPTSLTPRNIDSPTAEADNETIEASVEPKLAPKLKSQDSGTSSHCSSTSTALSILPPSVLPPRKRPFPAAHQETTGKSSMDKEENEG